MQRKEGGEGGGGELTAFSDMHWANGKMTGGVLVMWRAGIGWNWPLTWKLELSLKFGFKKKNSLEI